MQTAWNTLQMNQAIFTKLGDVPFLTSHGDDFQYFVFILFLQKGARK